MKNFKRFLLGVVFATLVFATCGMSAMAATTTKTLKQNVWFTQKDNLVNTYNKITVPNDGYITVTMSNNTAKEPLYIFLYDKKKTSVGTVVDSDEKTVTAKYPVAKGTYYLRGSSYANYKYKWKFTKAVNKTNYTASKAINLKANSEVVIINTPKNSYDRWYKIKLTKKKAITYWETGSGYAYLYDDEMDKVDTMFNNEDGSYYTKKKLPKGTYYVRVVASDYFNTYNKANMTTFKWK